ncbi:hypothetical protein BO94DRAFT_558007 [Aspergillus sclerotioniger CBS 115572]|uniref:Rhodopsin domain-containing protein n=1 Tax=Aspergillus sclerotioniger CBS 115572 TaxID=1450535 RepID=A0A317W640_9EURO|nr:hypothetical protein BO94DRAFT_558007 [Aspergillus sclerotioniger CBS 115572]PWY81559.1 hypothetical protein BO94DRAFT_558007 [Aspergillus sclerotioniger CBS 115572]
MIRIEKYVTARARLPFIIENWIELCLGVLVILLRLYSRAKVVGIRKWQADDFMSIIALFLWISEVTMFKLIVHLGTNTGLTDEERASISVKETHERMLGTQFLLVGWMLYVTLLWVLKACMLCFFDRLTIGLPRQKFVKYAAGFCFCAYIAAMMTILLHCIPLDRLWQIYPNPGCKLSALKTDAILLLIPIPLLVRVRLPMRRKLMAGLLLCGGIFVMIAALLRCFLSLWMIDSVNASNVWGVRETFIAVIAVNVPCIKPLFGRSASHGEWSMDPSTGKGGAAASHRLNVFNKSTEGQASRRRSGGELILKDSRTQFGYEIQGGIDQGMNEEAGRDMTGKSGIQVTRVYESSPGMLGGMPPVSAPGDNRGPT